MNVQIVILMNSSGALVKEGVSVTRGTKCVSMNGLNPLYRVSLLVAVALIFRTVKDSAAMECFHVVLVIVYL